MECKTSWPTFYSNTTLLKRRSNIIEILCLLLSNILYDIQNKNNIQKWNYLHPIGSRKWLKIPFLNTLFKLWVMNTYQHLPLV